MKAIKLNSINQGPGVGVVMTEKEARILAFHLMYSLVWSDQEDKYPGSGNVLRFAYDSLEDLFLLGGKADQLASLGWEDAE